MRFFIFVVVFAFLPSCKKNFISKQPEQTLICESADTPCSSSSSSSYTSSSSSSSSSSGLGLVAPQINAPVINGSSVNISWSSTGNNGYLIRARKNTPSAPMLVYENNWTNTSRVIDNLEAGAEYIFWIHTKGSNFDQATMQPRSDSHQVIFRTGSSSSSSSSSSYSSSSSVGSGNILHEVVGEVPVNTTPVCPTGSSNSISYYGITWNFSSVRPCGVFANGEPWVVGPLDITGITPNTSQTPAGRPDQHGSMLNPVPNRMHGFDGSVTIARGISYDPNLNVAKSFPLALVPGDSLVSMRSRSVYDNEIKTVAALTVLDARAPVGAFRPGVYGADRSNRLNEVKKWNVSNLRWQMLKNLTAVPSTPKKAVIEAIMPRLPWFEFAGIYSGFHLMGSDNTMDCSYYRKDQPFSCLYGREISAKLAEVGLWLNTNQSLEDKRGVATQMVQIGIDVYSYVKNGGHFNADGGHKQGRKLPLIFAALLLDTPDLKTYASNPGIFQEDQQVFIVCGPGGGTYCQPCTPEQSYIRADFSTGYANSTKGSQCVGGKLNDVNRQLWTPLPGDSWYGREVLTYGPEHVGLAEWGIRHSWYPFEDNRSWSATYRVVVGSGMMGSWLAAYLMDAQSLWNYPPAFAYMERYKAIQGTGGLAPHQVSFNSEMWNAHKR